MEKIVICIILLFDSIFCYPQAPAIAWQKTIGGDLNDIQYSISLDLGTGYIIGGYSESGVFGDKTDTSRGGYDYWVVKLDSIGNIIWQKTIGGNQYDQLYDISRTIDGGYILCGYSGSDISGEKTEESMGGTDFWVIKLDSSGDIEWQNTIGGSSNDAAWSIQQTEDDGYIVGGYSDSNISGDKTENSRGLSDFWVLKLDSSGNIIWQKTFGGSLSDALHSLAQTEDGGYILAGISESDISGEKTEDSQGTMDYWIIKIDSEGTIVWQNTIGGNLNDELYSVSQTFDSGFIIGGHSNSDISGDKTEESVFGSDDYWVVKLDNFGNIEWQNTIGGNQFDAASTIIETVSDNFLVGGISFSDISGDKSESSFGNADYWVVKLNAFGMIVWQKTIGGNSLDELLCLSQTSDQGYILGGISSSGISGNKTEPGQGALDYWIIKLYPDCPEHQEICNGMDDDCDGYIDEGFAFTNYFLDADGDTFGDPENDSLWCSPIIGYVSDSTDCDDSNPLIYPGATEILNGLDDNCNYSIDEGLVSIEDPISTIFKVFPNPNNGNFQIISQNLNAEKIIIEVINSIGERIYLNQFFSQEQINIKLPESFSGLANLIINDGNKIYINSLYVAK